MCYIHADLWSSTGIFSSARSQNDAHACNSGKPGYEAFQNDKEGSRRWQTQTLTARSYIL